MNIAYGPYILTTYGLSSQIRIVVDLLIVATSVTQRIGHLYKSVCPVVTFIVLLNLLPHDYNIINQTDLFIAQLL